MGRLEDLTGKKFGKLTVLERTENKGKRTMWLCKCECGIIKPVAAADLKRGSSKTCGCGIYDGAKRYTDLTGQRFGRLTVLNREENYIAPSGSTDLRWKCQCDCGNIIIVNSSNLKYSKQQSCGCYANDHPHKAFFKNEYKVEGNIVHIKSSNTGEDILCDLDDWNRLKDYYWAVDKHGYVCSMIKGKLRKMHKMIMRNTEYDTVDHINRNKLDNRKENLRYATYAINAQNRTLLSKNKYGCPGITKNHNRYVVTIGINGEKHYIGNFKTVEEAIKARKEAEEKYHTWK